MKTISYMVAIPKREEDIYDVAGMLNRLSTATGMKLLSHKFEEVLDLTLEMEGSEYTAKVVPLELKIPEMYRIQHFFPDVDIEAVENAGTGLEVAVEFGEDALASYHAQLKILHALLPETVAVIDESSEKILSGRWVALAAESSVPPAPRYIYTVQAVTGEEEDCVWLHSHGLNRCRLPELEILNSTKEMYQSHYNVIETMANRMLELAEPLEPKEPLFVARMTEEIPMVATLVEWQEAVEHYPEDMLGGKADREEGHNENTCAIFIYPTHEDVEKQNYAPVCIFDEYMEANPIYMISTEETERMKRLAGERLDYMLKAFKNKENKIIVKIGLKINEEFRDEQNQWEHIWFELLEPMEGKLRCRLIQEPYYVKDMHEGSEGIYPFDQITDWLIFTKERRITADDVYLLD